MSWRDEAWENGYIAAEAFFRREGHLLVPQRHIEAGYTLGRWISNQRANHKEGAVPSNRISRLERIGMVWDTIEAAWEDGYRVAETFFQREGHLRVPHRHTEAGYPLGNWVRSQRNAYGALSPVQVARLEKLGMTWRVRDKAHDAASWEVGYAVAATFRAREGHLLVPGRHVEAGYLLGKWITRQRTKHRRGKLPRECVARLENLGMIWRVRGH